MSKKETVEEVEVKKSKKLLPIILGSVGAVVVLALLITCICLNTGPKKMVKNYFSGYTSGNAKKVCKSLNKEILKAMDYSYEECIDDGEDYLEDAELEDVEISIGNKKVLSKDSVEEIHDQIEDEIDDDFHKISKVIRYRVKLSYEDDEGEEHKETMYVWVAKIKGKWGIIGMNDEKEYALDVL